MSTQQEQHQQSVARPPLRLLLADAKEDAARLSRVALSLEALCQRRAALREAAQLALLDHRCAEGADVASSLAASAAIAATRARRSAAAAAASAAARAARSAATACEARSASVDSVVARNAAVARALDHARGAAAPAAAHLCRVQTALRTAQADALLCVAAAFRIERVHTHTPRRNGLEAELAPPRLQVGWDASVAAANAAAAAERLTLNAASLPVVSPATGTGFAPSEEQRAAMGYAVSVFMLSSRIFELPILRHEAQLVVSRRFNTTPPPFERLLNSIELPAVTPTATIANIRRLYSFVLRRNDACSYKNA